MLACGECSPWLGSYAPKAMKSLNGEFLAVYATFHKSSDFWLFYLLLYVQYLEQLKE